MVETNFTFTAVDFDPFAGKEIQKVAITNESQKEIWLSCILGGKEASLAYNESLSLEFEGIFDFLSFDKAVQDLIIRHEALRATISGNGENLIIYNSIPFTVDFIDISTAGTEEQKAILHSFLKQEMNNPFDLTEGPLLRISVHKLNEQKHYFTLVIHHIVGDGWSLGIILEDLGKLYSAHVKNETIHLPTAPQISEYAVEQINYQKSAEHIAVQKYWLDKYQGDVPVLNLQTDNSRPASRSYKGDRLDFILDKETVAHIKNVGAKSGCSLVSTLISAFEIFLFHKTGQHDIIVGIPSAGQSATGNYGLVGHCVNLLPLRSTINPDLSFTEYLKVNKSEILDAYDHQLFTFGELLQKLNIKRDASRIPLVPVVFNVDMGMDSQVSFHNLKYKLISNPREYEAFEIFLNATGSEQSLILEWSYNTDLFNASTITRMMDEFKKILITFSNNPDSKIKDISLGNDEWFDQLTAWNNTSVAYPSNISVTKIFDEIAAKYPDKVAIKYRNEHLSFKKLRESSNQLANFLLEAGTKPGDTIGLALDRSPMMVISLIAILKTGAAYIPLDPEYPKERIEYMLSDSYAKILLTSKKYCGLFASTAKEFLIEDINQKIDGLSKDNLPPTIGGNELAYILYTSGSTGKPKGVQIEHHSLVNFLLSMQKKPGITAQDKLLAITTISFDIAGLELYLPLITGAELVLADTESTKDGRLLLEILSGQKITIMQATPSTWKMILDAGWDKYLPVKILVGGEALPKELASQLLLRSSELWNMYGPTETTIWSTTKRIHADDERITIGRPIDNTKIYILDENLKHVGPGSIGEIFISGEGVARGYLNRTDLTNEKFVYAFGNNTEKLYHTGDLGTFLENGEIQCLGRIDEQVKIRGHRIELGEIESCFHNQKDVKDIVVIGHEDKPGNHKLLAYITLRSNQAENSDAWKDRWDNIYNIGIETQKELNISERNLDTAFVRQLGYSNDYDLHTKEWLSQSVERIKACKPENVLEIGCGAGQLLFEIAPTVTSYIATDYAQTAITSLKSKLAENPQKWKNVTVDVAAANDFANIPAESLDMVIIHSVAQYFDNSKYLIEVIEKSAKSIRPGGCIFIGDMQGKSTINMLHAMDQLPKSADDISFEEFKKVVERRVKIEDELLADPAFFYLLPQLAPAIKGVDIQLRKGEFLNETTRYHFDVWLYVKKPVPLAQYDSIYQWNEINDVSSLEKILSAKKQTYRINNVPNKRITTDFLLDQLMNDETKNNSILSDIKKIISTNSEIKTIDPNTFWKLADDHGYKAYVRSEGDGTAANMEIVFIPAEKSMNIIPARPESIQLENVKIEDLSSDSYAHEIKIDDSQIEQWKNNLKQFLPDYMIPDNIIVLKKFPLTPNNKINKKALPKPEVQKQSKNNKLAVTDSQKTIATIWSEALGLNEISIDDNFFELGGHSLIAVRVMTQIEKKTGIRLPLTSLFESPTIEKLSQLIDKEPENVGGAYVPIKSGGSKPPLYIIHGAGLSVLIFNTLAHTLDADQPVIGLQAKGLNGEEEPLSKVEDMAAHYIQEILKRNPNGPYALAGYSFGGTIALEMGRQLLAMGKKSVFIGMLDAAAIQSDFHKPYFTRLTRKTIKSIRSFFYILPLRTKKLFLKLKKQSIISIIRQYLIQINILKQQESTEFKNSYKKVIDGISTAFHDYVITPYEGEINLFKANEQWQYLDDQKYLGWKNIAKGGIKIYNMPGSHSTMLEKPYVEDLAQALQKALNDFAKTEQSDSKVKNTFLKAV